MYRVIRWKGGVVAIDEFGRLVELKPSLNEAADRCYELNNEKNKTGNDEHAD